jgi:hypothetical protein
MSFSEFGTFIPGAYGPLAAGFAPCDAGIARAVVNNHQHVYDECGQVFLNFAARNSGAPFWTVGTSWQTLFMFGPYPVRLRASSGAYRLRTRLRIARTGASPVEVRMAVGSTRAAVQTLGEGAGGSSSVFTASVNSGTGTFFQPANALMFMDDAQSAASYAPMTAMNDAAGVTSKVVPQCFIGIFARSTVGTQDAVIFGAYAGEYVGL